MKIKFFLAGALLAIPSLVFGAGLTQHQFMADIAYELVSTPALSDCLGENRDAYLVGAAFPDAGYATLNIPLSNQAHSKSFINAFVEHIRQSYVSPYNDQYKLISFLLGIASHVADDPPYHAYFISEVADRDLNENYDLAHTLCDTGLEFTTIIDFNRWGVIPKVWIPVEDIQRVFEMLGSSYSREEVMNGNKVLSVAGLAERLVALLAYLPVRLIIPWAFENYYDFPQGGLYNGGEVSAAYYESIWDALMSPGLFLEDNTIQLPAGFLDTPPLRDDLQTAESRQFLYAFARRCLAEKAVRIDVTELEDGSVLLGSPRIIKPRKFFDLLLK